MTVNINPLYPKEELNLSKCHTIKSDKDNIYYMYELTPHRSLYVIDKLNTCNRLKKKGAFSFYYR